MNYYSKTGAWLRKATQKINVLLIPSVQNDYRPKFLQSNFLFYCVLFLSLVKIITIGISMPWPQNIFFADITKVNILNILNENRNKLGLVPLTENSELDQAAMLKAQDMIANGYFAHQSPKGINPWFWFRQVGYNYKYAGENLAVGFFDSKEVFDAWYNSPSHKENLLNPNYREIGMAILSGFGANNSTIVVQFFGSSKTQPAPKPTPKTLPTSTIKTVSSNPAECANVTFSRDLTLGFVGQDVKCLQIFLNTTPVTQVAISGSGAPGNESTYFGPKTLAALKTYQTQKGLTEINQVGPKTRLALNAWSSQINNLATVPTNLTSVPKEVLGQTTQNYQLIEGTQKTNPTLYARFINFMVYDYEELIGYLLYGCLYAIMVALLIDVVKNFSVEREKLILKSLLFIAIISLVIFVDKDAVNLLIPHQILI